MSGNDEQWDVVVVGAGAAGMTAACVAAAAGRSVLLVEQAGVVGGTTAISGGMVWIPVNHKAAAEGRPDSLEAARLYLSRTVPGECRERLEAFLTHGDEAIRDLEARTALRLRPVPVYPDYYPDLPGATTGGRVLEPVPFDGRALGPAFALLRDPLPEFTLFGGMMISRQDIPHLRGAGRSPRSAWHVARLLAAYGWQRLQGARRGTTLYLGNALAARLLKSVLDLGVTLRTDAAVVGLEWGPDNRVSRLDIAERAGGERDGTPVRRRIIARCGVILAAGGMSHDAELRRVYLPEGAADLSATIDNEGAPCGARLAKSLGAALSPASRNAAFWVPVSRFTRRDGRAAVYPHIVTDRAKPGLIAVDSTGRRFVNEAVSYHEFGLAQLARHHAAIPAWLLCDSRFLWKYGLGKIKPFALSISADVASGYLKRAGDIAGLAGVLGIPGPALTETVAAFNRHAERGEDPAFGRGGNAYQRALGDVENALNPCVAPIVAPPFYAVAVRPTDLGFSAGIVTDTVGRVLTANETPVPGLFACGNDMASVMEGAYPGPGITLGPALTFGWLAARAAMEEAA